MLDALPRRFVIADQGHAESLRELGMLYASGKVVRADLVRALIYFDLAVEFGDDQSILRRDMIAASLNAQQLQYARMREKEWREGRGL